ncbi:hypothetical protein FZ046_10495 [Mycolicibacterium grossiae]|uniref:Uncharacterized protein n=2 Tax=Mycolicibacterium grossiae TaxID=1552759 RepID=A0A1E8QBX5_9MYCO|nr:hypothetical protein BEL07_00975 [Mycolicibacterium grossiae]QEM45143.1 hypothetical protein FZ046_10495 [Mycolicibacterium grossiae]
MRTLVSGCAAALVGVLTVMTAASAVADPATLPVDPNVVTDSTAYIAQQPILDPNGQRGVEQTFTHRDGSRQITDTIVMLADPQAAVASLEANRSDAASMVVRQTSTPVPVGENGTVITGTSPDGSHAVTVLLFTRGATSAEIAFQGGPNDPVPNDLVIDYGQRQDDAIQAG